MPIVPGEKWRTKYAKEELSTMPCASGWRNTGRRGPPGALTRIAQTDGLRNCPGWKM